MFWAGVVMDGGVEGSPYRAIFAFLDWAIPFGHGSRVSMIYPWFHPLLYFQYLQKLSRGYFQYRNITLVI
ncbi:hypothetical protein NECAME_17554 [Necator americanus]|uniref:Uncharacterized protein n=1 Tax=Necator americanus TaxID=51031 RepID=W2TM44_NECAM|nr:hypothetical protein NECAME_17554 [Necator americanus]ETN83190.1 hypothetical protein NECAME_17554 [Necator americanus]